MELVDALGEERAPPVGTERRSMIRFNESIVTPRPWPTCRA